MTIRGKRCKDPLKILADAELERIHEASLEILERVGVKFAHQRALDLMADAGCRVNRDTQVAKIGADVVREALKRCPRGFTIRARKPENSVRFEGCGVHFGTGTGSEILDVETGQRRPCTVDDLRNSLRLIDALENITFVMGAAWPPLTDMSAAERIIELYRECEKAICFGVFYGGRAVPDIFDAIGVNTYLYVLSTPPLGYPDNAIEGLFIHLQEHASAGHAVSIGGSAMVGGNYPATFAGAMAQQTAEILAGIVLVQLVQPGTGVMPIYGSYPTDMRTGGTITGGIETSMMHVAGIQIARYYGLPGAVVHPMTEAKVPDQQAGYERGMHWLSMGLAGANYIAGAGRFYRELLWDYGQFVIDNDVCGMVGRFLDGIQVDEESLALDLIAEVGTLPGHYLNKEHTRRLWRRDRYMPSIGDRSTYTEWVRAGSKDIVRRARERAREIIETHRPTPLPDNVEKELQQILARAAKVGTR